MFKNDVNIPCAIKNSQMHTFGGVVVFFYICNMKQLEKSFVGKGEVSGFVFNQVTETERGYIYSVTQQEGKTHYEVFQKRINERFNCVSYPTAKAFGVWAWTANDYNKALKRLNEFV